mmetsp:Transcript_21114/g.43224  ORF Transcript_21114/g.43224 Transcript_21114/m.43224 type:complete len:500 (+) Transcript_21114:480-1979(+)
MDATASVRSRPTADGDGSDSDNGNALASSSVQVATASLIVDGTDGGNGDTRRDVGDGDVRYVHNVEGMVGNKPSAGVVNAVETTLSPTAAVQTDGATQSPTSLETSTLAPTKSPKTSVPTFHPSTLPTAIQSSVPTFQLEGGDTDAMEQGEIWERPFDSPDNESTSQEGSNEIWELPGNDIKEDDIGDENAATVIIPDECDTETFLGKGGLEMELFYDYDLLYRSGANVQSDIIEMDELIANNTRTQLELTCDDVTDIFWIGRGSVDVQDRLGLCTSREGRSAAEYNLGCVPMKGDIKIFYQPLADKAQVEEAVLDIIKRNGPQTKSQSWKVYVDNRQESETTGVVPGAVVGDWTEQNVDTVTVKSILIYSGIAVFSCLCVFLLGVFFFNQRRRGRIKKELAQYKEFEEARKAKRARRVATADEELSDRPMKEAIEARVEESPASGTGFEVEPCKSGTDTVVPSKASDLDTTEALGETNAAKDRYPVACDCLDAIVLCG